MRVKTVLVTGSDTGVGKTWVVGTLASLLCSRGFRVQIVKPVETGILDTADSDAMSALKRCDSKLATAYVLHHYREALAPLAAARLHSRGFSFDAIADEVLELPEVDWRIVEGAGAIALPLDENGRDWADFYHAIKADVSVCVVENRLGGIGQARMALLYAKNKGLKTGVWLNEVQEQSAEVLESTLLGLKACDAPIWATQSLGSSTARMIDESWFVV